MAGIYGEVSKGTDVNVGLEFLEGFLTAIEATGIINNIRSSYKSTNINTLKFRFTEITRDFIDPILVNSHVNSGYFLSVN
jgi:hypothetical protein